MRPSTLRSTLIMLFMSIWGIVLLLPSSMTASAQEEPPPPVQVLQTTLAQLVPPDTPVGRIEALSFLDADLSKDETVSGIAFTFSKDEMLGVWIANYSVISEHPTGIGQMDIPLSQSCQNQVQINIINTREAPAEALVTPDEEFFNLSISEAAASGFSTPHILGEYQKVGLPAGNYVGTQSFHGLDLHFIRVPLFQEGFDRNTLKYTNMIQGYHTQLVWQDSEWIFMVRDKSEMTEYYQLFVGGEDGGNHYYYQDTCPIGRHPQIDAFHWAEILYQTYRDAGLLSGQAPTPSPANNVSCTLRPEIGKPLILEADFSDGQGNFLKNQPLWITGQGELGQLINLDNPMTSGKDWVAPGSGGLLAETNPYGRLTLPAAVALSQAKTPISSLSPLTGSLSFTMPGPEGTTIPIGHCDFSIDYIAMTDFYYGAVGLDPTVDDDLPPACLTELGLSGKPLPPKFQTFTSGDALLIGSCGTPGSAGFTDGGIVIEYIDNTAVSVQYRQPDWITLYDHPPYGEYIIGHNTLGPSISADHNSLFTFGFNKAVDELASKATEYSIKLVFKRGLGPVTGIIADLVGSYAADQYAPLTFQEKNIMALRVLRLRSLVEVSYEQPGGEVWIRTFEGSPEILTLENNTTVALAAGQETKLFVENPLVTDFDIAMAETWWESPQWEAVNDQSVTGQQVDLVGNLAQADNRLVLFVGALCLLVLLGGVAVAVLLFIIRQKRKAQPTGADAGERLLAGQTAPGSKSRGLTCLLVVVGLIFLIGCCGSVAYFGRTRIGEFIDGGLPQLAQEISPTGIPDTPISAITPSEPETAIEPGVTPTPESLSGEQPAQTPAQESKSEPTKPLGNALSDEGPWIVFEAEDGLWALNPDGSGLTHLAEGPIVAPASLSAGISPAGGYLAFVTASDAFTLQNLTLKLLKLPEGTVETITRLTSPETEPEPQFDICDPKHEAARAVTIDNGLGWSRDGSQLAFIGVMQGPTADLYIYSRIDGDISHLTSGPSQAYNVNWSNSGQYVVHFGASCFGTGAGFNMMGAWAANVDNGEVIDLYTPNPESYGEQFVTNEWGPQDVFYVATVSGCPLRDLRRVDIETREVTSVYAGCFNDYTLGATGMIALLTSQDFSEDPGLYIYAEGGSSLPFYIPGENGYQVKLHNDLALIETIDYSQSYSEIRTVNFLNGEPGWYTGQGGFPVFSPDDAHFGWLEGDTFYLGDRESGQAQVLSNQGALYPFWYEEVGVTMGDVRQHLLYFAGEPSATLYLASAPDYKPVAIATDLNPQGELTRVFSSK